MAKKSLDVSWYSFKNGECNRRDGERSVAATISKIPLFLEHTTTHMKINEKIYQLTSF